jgi:hypothetical protein
MREVQDHYFRQAKAEGYVSRAAYKLLEINERKKERRSASARTREMSHGNPNPTRGA